MRRRGFMILALIGLIAALAPLAPAEASTASTELYLPAAGSGPGAPPSFWHTTVWVFNPNDTAANVEFSFLRRFQYNDPSAITSPMTLNPGEVREIDDAVFTLFGLHEFGAMRAVSDVPIHMSARIYSQGTDEEARDSKGQFMAAIPAEQALGEGETTDLLGLTNIEGGDFRYNVGLVETTGGHVWVRVELYGASGNTWISKSVELWGHEQKQMSIDDLFSNIGRSDNFRLRVTGAAGGKVIVFGSRVTNGSQDATTFEMTRALP